MMSRPNPDRPQIIGIDASPWLRLHRAYQAHLARVRKYRRARAAPRCYLSHLPEQITLAEKLSHDLQYAGVVLIKQAIDVVDLNDFVIVLDTDAYRRAFQSHDSVLAADRPLIYDRLGKRGRVIALRVEGETKTHRFQKCEPGRFCDETHYPVGLFDLVLDLYSVPLTHAGFAPLRQALHEQWEQTPAGEKSVDAASHEDAAPPLKIFISYSHKDEKFKGELVTMLASLKRRGIVDAWQDGRIEPGDEWYQSIQDAMEDCDLALLLVSPDYIASHFIQEEEQPKLLQRRREMQLRVIPIIVRPCTWTSEPVLKDLQALPKNGKAVIRFPKASGARDQVWADIAAVIEERAKAKVTP